MKKIILILLLLLPLCLLAADSFDYKALDNAESLFKQLKSHKYVGAWNSMTEKSHDTIVNDVYDSIKKSGDNSVSREKIAADFAECGELCTSYWTSFMQYFDPKVVLDDSTWSTGDSDKNYCEIILQYKDAPKPAVLKMYKENGTWKVGFTESFWLRKFFM